MLTKAFHILHRFLNDQDIPKLDKLDKVLAQDNKISLVMSLKAYLKDINDLEAFQNFSPFSYFIYSFKDEMEVIIMFFVNIKGLIFKVNETFNY